MGTISRRDLIMTGAVSAAAISTAAAAAKLPARPATAPEALAKDETYWRQVAAQYDITRDVIQLDADRAGDTLVANLRAVIDR